MVITIEKKKKPDNVVCKKALKKINWISLSKLCSWSNLTLDSGWSHTQFFFFIIVSFSMNFDSVSTVKITKLNQKLNSLRNFVRFEMRNHCNKLNIFPFFVPVIDLIAFFVICKLNILLIEEKNFIQTEKISQKVVV